MARPMSNLEMLSVMTETDLRDLFTFIVEQRAFDTERLETTTKQNERALIKGRLEAFDDVLTEARIISRSRERFEQLNTKS